MAEVGAAFRIGHHRDGTIDELAEKLARHEIGHRYPDVTDVETKWLYDDLPFLVVREDGTKEEVIAGWLIMVTGTIPDKEVGTT